ncbi:MAG: U32 family peptidase [Fibrobacteria bacterium]|nr:U32 family peptidase [Fibrobacteria bacterium]
MTKTLELLSPAGNLNLGKAAIDAGADAVYIGGPKFGARAAAGNSLEDIEKLIGYAHFFRAKVYLALNTLLRDDEIPWALEMINNCTEAGIDGVIIQDYGLIEAGLPPVPVIASTQMDNATSEQVRFLESLGVSRAILARELSLEEITEIKKNTKEIELEVFVHGALCVGYSGRCYLSEAVAGRSGNRGVCAQPCRSDYRLIDGKGKVLLRDKHLLSLKDLNLSGRLGELVGAGVTSFKIEGRLKDEAYVKNITASYRMQLDDIIRKRPEFTRSSSGKSVYGFTPDPDKTFNRGYITHFFDGRKSDITSPHSPKAMGQYLGTVRSQGRGWIEVDSPEAIHNNDGLCFLDTENRLTGFKVNRADGGRVTARDMPKIPEGTALYRNLNHSFSQVLMGSAAAVRKVDVSFNLKETPEGLCLEVTDEDGVCAKADCTLDNVPANNETLARDTATVQLMKTGTSRFVVTHVKLSLNQMLFIKKSVLNGLRRDVLSLLETKRIQSYDLIRGDLQRDGLAETSLPDLGSRNITNRHAEEFFDKHGMKTGAENSDDAVMTTKFCLLYEMGLCIKETSGALAASGITQPLFIENNRRRFRLKFDCKLCRMQLLA